MFIFKQVVTIWSCKSYRWKKKTKKTPKNHKIFIVSESQNTKIQGIDHVLSNESCLKLYVLGIDRIVN